MNGNQVGFYLSISSPGIVPQPDPSASRGGYRSSTTLYDLESTLSANMTAKDIAVDTVSGADPGTGAWLLFVTGANHSQARRVESWDGVSSAYILDEPFDSLGSSGDYYRVFKPQAIFDSLGGVVCGAGQVDYRMVYARNSGGATLSNRWTRVERLVGASVLLEFAATYRDYGESNPHDYMADVYTAPDFSSPWLGASSTDYIGRFGSPLAFDEVYDQPPDTDDWTSTETSALWIKRTAEVATPDCGQCVYLVTFGFDDTGGDPDPMRSSFLILFDVDGFNPTISIDTDRKPRICGGLRTTATVTVQETGVAVEGVPVQWSLDGDGTLYVPDDILTDDAGQTSCVYHSPTDQTKSGNDVTLEARL